MDGVEDIAEETAIIAVDIPTEFFTFGMMQCMMYDAGYDAAYDAESDTVYVV